MLSRARKRIDADGLIPDSESGEEQGVRTPCYFPKDKSNMHVAETPETRINTVWFMHLLTFFACHSIMCSLSKSINVDNFLPVRVTEACCEHGKKCQNERIE